jgi:hypothetical protein
MPENLSAINNPRGATMPAVNKDQALELLTREVKNFAIDELLEVYNEAFPTHPTTEEEARKDPSPLVEQLVQVIKTRLEVDEVVSLWRLIIPKHYNVWYDEEEERIHYQEVPEVVSYE